jgi:hypothetical protein
VGRFLPVAAAWDVSISWIGTCANNDSAHQGQKKPASAGLRVLHCVEASANRERFQYAAPLLESRVRMTHILRPIRLTSRMTCPACTTGFVGALNVERPSIL